MNATDVQRAHMHDRLRRRACRPAATSVGIRTEDRQPVVCAQFGLADLFAMVIRPNTTLVARTVYQAKTQRWRSLWPQHIILPWPAPDAHATGDR